MDIKDAAKVLHECLRRNRLTEDTPLMLCSSEHQIMIEMATKELVPSIACGILGFGGGDFLSGVEDSGFCDGHRSGADEGSTTGNADGYRSGHHEGFVRGLALQETQHAS